MRIAIVGSGIAGNAAAYRLAAALGPEAITVFEREPRPGGHSHTVDVRYPDGESIAVDTGFIVYNTLNYPRLTALFDDLSVPTEASDMSFSLSLDSGALEWSGQEKSPLRGIFAQWGNATSPRFLAMLGGIHRFNRRAPRDLASGRLAGRSLGDYLIHERYPASFRDNYVVPMGAAIWSMPPASLLNFPAESFVRFFERHRLMSLDRPQWRTVTGGSRTYVKALTAHFSSSLRLDTPIRAISRLSDSVEIDAGEGRLQRFDAVILACHSDEALALLADASDAERAILGAIRFRENTAILHADSRLMPRRRAAWASWNVARRSDEIGTEISLTYWMNRLQNLNPHRPLFVSLNPTPAPREDLVFARFAYAHPQFDAAAIAAQGRLPDIQGQRASYFCGAWTGYGFHEDGLASGLAAAETLLARMSVSGSAR